MAVLKDCANGDGERASASTTKTKASARFCGRVWCDFGKLLLVIAFAMRADNAVFPKHRFKMLAGFVIRAEAVKELNQSKVFFGLFCFHAINLP